MLFGTKGCKDGGLRELSGDRVRSAHVGILIPSECLVVSFLSLDVFKQRFDRKVDKVHASGEWLAFGASSNLNSLTLKLDKVISIYCFCFEIPPLCSMA